MFTVGKLRAVVLSLGLNLCILASSTAQTIYWTDVGTGMIQRFTLNGDTQVEDLVTFDAVEPLDIAIDGSGGKMYWTEAFLADFQIMRSNLDGSAIELLVTHLTSPSGIELDTFEEKIYWTDIGTGKIQRSKLDGSDVEDLVNDAAILPIDIAIDPFRRKMYWTEGAPADFNISGANLDGSQIEGLITDLHSPSGIAVDSIAGKIYWTDTGLGKIQRANLDGTDVEDLVTTSVVEPVRIALDTRIGKMHWTERSPGDFLISRANLDGSEVEFLITGLSSPSGIALDNAAVSQAIVPIQQDRSLSSFVIVPPCGGEENQDDEASDFGPFASITESSIKCGKAFGHATGRQVSRIDGTRITAEGNSISNVASDAPTVMIAIASSIFDVEFELTSDATFKLIGQLSMETVGDFLPGLFADIRLEPASNDPIVQESLIFSDDITSIDVERSGLMSSGTYGLSGQAQIVIDHKIPPDLMADVSFELMLQVANGDGDHDADVDILDFRTFNLCASGPDARVGTHCEPFDFDFDGDVDWGDFNRFQLLYREQ